MIGRCDSCQCWKRHHFTSVAEPLGDCRADPPRVIDAIIEHRLRVITDLSEAVEDATKWPMTKGSDGCARHDTGMPVA